MLRTIRLTTAIVCFTLITLLFLDFTGTLHTWFGWLAKIQFLPALLALNIGVVLFLVVLTFLYLLLCYLSVGSVSGHCFVGIRQTKEKPVPLFTSNEMVAVWRFRSIHYYDGCRIELFGYLAGTV